MIFKLTILSLFVLGNYFPLLSSELPIKPSLLLQAVCWEKYKSRNLVYYPWGNVKEENATKINLNIGFSLPTHPFVYYGSSPLQLFEKKFSYPSSNTSSDAETTEEKLSLVAEYDFEIDPKTTKNSLLLLIDKKGEKKLNIYPISLNQQNLPYGAINCYSQHKDNLYLAYGGQKQSLKPGKSVRLNYEKDSTQDIRIFTYKAGKYIESMSDYVSVNEESRGIIFFSSYRNRLRMKSYLFNRLPIESATGYNEMAQQISVVKDNDDNSTID
jgi:hypothetical protein